MPATNDPLPPESPASGAYLTSSSLHQMESFRLTHKTQVLTILFTDLVGSTDLQDKLGNHRAAEVVQHHRSVFREVLQPLDGLEVETAGDSFLVVFAAPSEAVKFSLYMQAGMRKARETAPELPGVRVGIHQGQVVVEHHDAGGKAMDIYGLQVSTAARIMALADGGRILCSRAVFDDARAILRGEDFAGLTSVAWRNHGPYKFKGVEDSYDVCEVGEEGQTPLTAPAAGEKAWPAGRGEEELGWRPAAGVSVPGTKWRLQERLGKQAQEAGAKFRGEFGEVWRAYNSDLKSSEVFKFCFKVDRVSALKREARLLKQLQQHRHPNLVEVSDVTVGDRPPYYLEMEYVQGPSLEEWLATNPPPKERLEIVAQVADALDTVHAAGIYHRDIKPSNILLTHRKDGALQAKLTDFGLGAADDKRLLQSIEVSRVEPVAGTWDFIAPELRAGGKASPQSDIYSLGLTLFQLVTGNLKSQAGPGWETTIDSEVLRGDIAKCMDSDPKKRWCRAGELAQALRSHDERRQRLQLQVEQEAHRRRLGRVRRIAAAAAVLVVAAAAGVAVYIVSMQREQARTLAEKTRADQQCQEAKAATTFLQEMLSCAQPGVTQGKVITVQMLLDAAGNAVGRELSTQPPVEARIRQTIGDTYFTLGLYAPAADHLTKALAIMQRDLGGDSNETLSCMNDLACVLDRQDKTADAEKLYSQAFAAEQRVLGGDSPLTLRSMTGLALVWRKQGKNPQAEDLLRKVLDAEQRIAGPSAGPTIAAMHNLAMVLMNEGKFPETEDIYRKVIEVEQQALHLPANDPDLLNSTNNLAYVLEAEGKFDESEKLFRSTLAAKQQILGKDHPDTLRSMSNFAMVLCDLKRFAEAEDLSRQALDSQQKILGKDHEDTLRSMNNLARALGGEGKFDQAEDLFRQTLAGRQKVLGKDQYDTLVTMNDFAVLLDAEGKVAEAEDMYRQTLAGRQRVMGPNSPCTLASLESLAKFLESHGKADEAKQLRAQQNMPSQSRPATAPAASAPSTVTAPAQG